MAGILARRISVEQVRRYVFSRFGVFAPLLLWLMFIGLVAAPFCMRLSGSEDARTFASCASIELTWMHHLAALAGIVALPCILMMVALKRRWPRCAQGLFAACFDSWKFAAAHIMIRGILFNGAGEDRA